MHSSGLVCILAVATLLPHDQARSVDTEPQLALVEVDLSESDTRHLIAAPQVFFNAKPSSALANAWANGQVERVRADRVVGGDSNTVQGWIYYPVVAGYQPMVLCVSESFPVIQWVHCQEHSETLPMVIPEPDP